jgi:hypothetical protein
MHDEWSAGAAAAPPNEPASDLAAVEELRRGRQDGESLN